MLSLELLNLEPETEEKEKPINVFEIKIAERPVKTGFLSEEDKERLMEFRDDLFNPDLSGITRFADDDLKNYMYLNFIGFTEEELEVFKFDESFSLDLEIISKLFEGEFKPYEEINGKRKRDLLMDYMPFLYAMKLYYPEKYTQLEQVIDKDKLNLYCSDWMGFREPMIAQLSSPEELTALAFVTLLYPDDANELGITEDTNSNLEDGTKSYLIGGFRGKKPFNYLSALFACRICCPKLYETVKPSKQDLEEILEGYIAGISDENSDYQNDERLSPIFFLRVLMEDKIDIKNLGSLLKLKGQETKIENPDLPVVRKF